MGRLQIAWGDAGRSAQGLAVIGAQDGSITNHAGHGGLLSRTLALGDADALSGLEGRRPYKPVKIIRICSFNQVCSCSSSAKSRRIKPLVMGRKTSQICLFDLIFALDCAINNEDN